MSRFSAGVSFGIVKNPPTSDKTIGCRRYLEPRANNGLSLIQTFSGSSPSRTMLSYRADNFSAVGVFPAVVVYHWTRGIKAPRYSSHAFDESILSCMLLPESGEAHAFVHRHPGDNARMVIIAPYGVLPFGGKTLFSS